MDDPNLEDYNVDKKVDDFLDYVKNQQASYKTKNLIMTMGDDFQYSNAHMYFKNIDKMIRYVNERQLDNASNVNIFYSTTACYLYALNKENTTWPVKSDDFFPYAHRGHSYWTGYFTSRPTLKYYTRQVGNVLQAARLIGALRGSTVIQVTISLLKYWKELREFYSIMTLWLALNANMLQRTMPRDYMLALKRESILYSTPWANI